jgi:molecular chaperone DnaK (HSP70)
LAVEGGVFEVISTGGDTRLGGEDFDLTVTKFLMKEAESMGTCLGCCLAFLLNFPRFPGLPDFSKDQRAIKRLGAAVEAAKRVLSTAQSTEIVVEALCQDEEKKESKGERKSYDFKYTFDRAKFEKLNEGYFVRCIDTVKKGEFALDVRRLGLTSSPLRRFQFAVLKDGRSKPEEIDDIVLVGGSTRIPKIQEMLQQYFGGKELCRSINPDEAVAYGAAVQGAILSGRRSDETKDLLLMDVTPLSLGIETQGRVMSVIIPRNSRIPIMRTQTYTTTENNQTEVCRFFLPRLRTVAGAHSLSDAFCRSRCACTRVSA